MEQDTEVLILTDIAYVGFIRYAGAYRVATELNQNSIKTRVFDFYNDLSLDDLKSIFQKHISSKTLYVGISTTFLGTLTYKKKSIAFEPQQDESWYTEVVKMIKSLNPNTKVVLGGTYAGSFKYKQLVDYWVTGIADQAAVQLAKHLKFGDSLKTHDLPDSKGKVVLGDSDFPYDDFSTSQIHWTKEDFISPDEFVPIEIARGCAFRCSFCNFRNGKNKNDYLKDETALRTELLQNYDNFGLTNYMICDDNLNDSLSKVEYLHRVFTSLPFKVNFISYNRLDIFKRYPEMAKLLLEAGQVGAHFGIETLNQASGKKIGKGLHPDETKNLLHFLKDAWKDKVIVGASFIVGLPEETPNTIQETFQWLTSKDCPMKSYMVLPLLFTSITSTSDIQKNPEKFKFKVTGPGPYDWENQYFTGQEAKAVAEDFMEKTRFTNKSGSFIYAQFRNLGYTHDEAKNFCFADEITPSNKTLLLRKNLKDRYLKQRLQTHQWRNYEFDSSAHLTI